MEDNFFTEKYLVKLHWILGARLFLKSCINPPDTSFSVFTSEILLGNDSFLSPSLLEMA